MFPERRCRTREVTRSGTISPGNSTATQALALSDADRDRYSWQFGVDGFGEAGQLRLKRSSVLISRCGGLGGPVAQELAVAGVGKIVIAHGGALRLNDLNRQILGHEAGIEKERAMTFSERLRSLNSDIVVEAHSENISEDNVEALVAGVDLVVDCAPLFAERYALNREAVKNQKPMIECAVYDLEGYITTFIPGLTPCLSCLYSKTSTTWVRKFPVFGAVSGTLGCMAAIEAIKLLSGMEVSLANKKLLVDLRDFTFRKVSVRRHPDCDVCSSVEHVQT